LGLSLTPSHASAAPTDAYDDERDTAEAIVDALEEGDAKAFRFATTSQLEVLQSLDGDDLEPALRAYVDTAHERGVEGLEGALVSTAAALGARDFAGFVAARELLAELELDAEKERARPNALVPIARPGSPIVHYLPAGMVAAILQGQASSGLMDIEGAIDESFCAPGAIEAFAARWGSELGALLQSMCDASGSTGGGGMGGNLGLGYAGELSLLDCLMAHQETRAQRVEALMLECMESVIQGGGGNPLAAGSGTPWYPYGGGSTFDWVFPVRDAPYSEGRYEIGPDGFPRETGRSFYTAPPDDGGDLVYDVEFNADGSTKTKYTNDSGVVVMEIERDGSGNVKSIDYSHPDGTPARSEQHHADGSSSTTDYGPDGSRLETEYDSEGNITEQREYDSKGAPVPPPEQSTPPEEFTTTPECRELTLALLEAADAEALMAAGAIDPRTVNPNPDAEVEPSPELDCLELTGGMLLDSSFDCREDLMLCSHGQVLDSGCNCQDGPTGIKVERHCGMTMRCADGTAPSYVGNECTCAGEAAPVVDPGVGPGPRPGPVDRIGGHPGNG
jgi:hypothetical protein